MILNYKKAKNRRFLLASILSVMTLSSCNGAAVETSATTPEIKSVATLTTSNEECAVYLDYNGYVVAKDIKNLSFEQPGKVKSVYVKTGEQINQGDLLAEIDTSNLEMAKSNATQDILLAKNSITQIENSVDKIKIGIEAEKVNLKKVESAYEAEILNLKKIEDSYSSAINAINLTYDNRKDAYDKMSVLYQTGGVSKYEYDNAKYALDSVTEELEKTKKNRDNDINLQKKNIENMKNNIELQKISIKAMENDILSANAQSEAAALRVNQAQIGSDLYVKQLNDCQLISPISGFVVDVVVQAGEITNAGYPVVVVTSREQVVNIGVSVEDYSKIKVEMPVTMVSSNETFTGKISTIAQYPDQSSRTYTVEIISDNMNLPSGSIVDVKIPIEKKNSVSVPVSSVINIDGVNYIYKLEKDDEDDFYTVLKQEVVLGDVSGENVFVENLSPGVIFVSDGVKDIKENSKVLKADGSEK